VSGSTFVGVVEVPDLSAVVVLQQVDDGSGVRRSHVQLEIDHFIVVVVVVVVVIVCQQEAVVEVAVTPASAAAGPRDADRQSGGDEREAEGGAERTQGVDGGGRVRAEHGENAARQQPTPCIAPNSTQLSSE